MPSLPRVTLLALALSVSACRTDDSATATPEPTPDVAGPKDDADAGSNRPAYVGASHSANIDLVTIDPTGTAALSRDAVGGLRLWPALDGSLEPQAVPIEGPSSFGLLKAADAFVVMGVESSGGARFVSVDAQGHTEELQAIPPFNPVQEVAAVRAGAEGAGRFVVLMRDGSIRIYGAQGEQLGAFDENDFQPFSIRPSGDGRHLVALSRMDRVGANERAEAQRLTFSGSADAPKLERSGTPRILSSTLAIGPTSAVVSPDGGLVAVLARGNPDNTWAIELHDLDADGEPSKVEVSFSAHQTPHLGFTDPSRLLVSSNEGVPSKLIDTQKRSVRLRTSIPQDFNHQGRAQACAAGRQVVGYGTFLFVHDVGDRKHRFLGYRATQGSSVGLSPSGSHVAWAYSQGPIVVESTDGSGSSTVIEYGSDNFSNTRVRFLDDEHVVVVDGVGEISLVHWPTQEVVARTGTMSNVRGIHMDPEQGILVLERFTHEAWVFEVSAEDGFAGPYIVGDTSRFGILRPSPPSDVVLWSMQASTNEIRRFTLDQLRADLTVSETDALGVALESGQSPPLAVDREGRQYGVRWNGTSLEMFVRMGTQTVASKAVQSNDINQVIPSPHGDRVLVVFNRSGAVSVAMHDAETLESLWSYSTGVFNSDTAWSEDGRFVALAANTGAVLLDAATGETVRSRCGLRFETLAAPPSTAFSSPNRKSLCEP